MQTISGSLQPKRKLINIEQQFTFDNNYSRFECGQFGCRASNVSLCRRIKPCEHKTVISNILICLDWRLWKRWKRSKKAWKSRMMKKRRVWLTRTHSLRAIKPKQQNRKRPLRLRFKWINRKNRKSLNLRIETIRKCTFLYFFSLQNSSKLIEKRQNLID